MTQPEALRLANELEDEHDPWPRLPAAAELRRLHAENERIGPLAERVLELKAQRDALLEALRAMRVKCGKYACCVCDLADAAIAKVEEQT